MIILHISLMVKSLVTVLVAVSLGRISGAEGDSGAISGSAGPTGRVAVFISQRFFHDEEFEPVVRLLSRAGFEVVTVSVETTACQSMNGELVKPRMALRDVRAGDFAGLVVIGGTGIITNWDDSLLQERCREFVAAGRVVAAIGIAPVLLARAGVLKGLRATVFRDSNAKAELESWGCRFSFNPVVTSGRVVTGASAESARPFARAVIKLLKRG